MKTVGILGASGFTGTALVEHLLSQGDYETRCFAHSARNAAGLARLGVAIDRLDILDRSALERSLAGCDVVVNCTMGPRPVMFDGLENVLSVCSALRVQRYVHLSSITVYGDPPLPESVVEDARPRPRRGTYGWIKLQQDNMVQRAAKGGLPSVVLCPPIVSGPRSTQLRQLVDRLRTGRFALVDGGAAPCPLVDVRNLAHAIERSFHARDCDARRIYVLDEHTPTWEELIDSIVDSLGLKLTIPRMDGDEAQAVLKSRPRRSVRATIRHLASAEVRRSLQADPLIGSLAGWVKRSLPASVVARVKSSKTKRSRPAATTSAKPPRPPFDKLQLERQLRGVRHGIGRAKAVLQYEPPISYSASIHDFCEWYATERGWNCAMSDLVAVLEDRIPE